MDDFSGHCKRFDIDGRQRFFEKQQGSFNGADQAPGAGVFFKGASGQISQRCLIKFDIDTIGGKIEFFPEDDRVVGIFQDFQQIILG